MRVEKNKLAEEYGFAGMGGGATTNNEGVPQTPKKPASTPKRKKNTGDGGDAPVTPAKKAKKGKAVEEEAAPNNEGTPSNDMSDGIKAEEEER